MKVFDRKIIGRVGLKTLIPILMVLIVFKSIAAGQATPGIPSDNAGVHQWVEQHFAKGIVPPFSFVYGGKSSVSFIKNWQFGAEKLKSTEPDTEETVYTWYDKQSGLAVKCQVTIFDDFQSVEWVLNFVNTSQKNSPLIEKAAVIDYSFDSGTQGPFILHHARGSNAERRDFQPIDEKMKDGENIFMSPGVPPGSGRSSDNTAFPFFNIEMPGGQGIMEGTQIYREHPEWLIKRQGNVNSLFDLGNTKARLWLTDYISAMIKNEGIDYYRQDCNFDPMAYWIANDKPGRKGISEIRHIEGLYAYWDSLLVRFPHLLIDNCASGGRRIDLETTSRSAPLWRTDYQYGEPNGYQCHTFGLNFYLPIHGTAIYKTDSYTFRSGLGGTAVMNWEVTGRNSEPIPEIQKRIKDFKSLRPYFYADYYPLTEGRDLTGDNAWLAYQLNRPEQKDGIILAFRRGECESESIRINLRGLDENATYELFYEDYNLRTKNTGKELSDGFDVTIPEKPSSLLINYKQVIN